jgi:phosphoesterase RecJ-like protein
MLFKQIYDVMPKSQALLHATCVQKAKFNADNSLSWVIISREDLAQTGAIDEHIEGLVDILRRISTVRVAALLKATPDGMTKVSLRSDDHRINVAEIAERWNGGGHKMASGCTITKPPEQVETELIPILEAAIQAVNTPVTPSR